MIKQHVVMGLQMTAVATVAGTVLFEKESRGVRKSRTNSWRTEDNTGSRNSRLKQ